MHSATQIQTQIHGAGAHGTQPLRGGRGQVQGHHIVITQQVGGDFPGTQLRFRIAQAHQQRGADTLARARVQAGIIQSAKHSLTCHIGDFATGFGMADLNGRRIGIQIGERIKAADNQRSH